MTPPVIVARNLTKVYRVYRRPWERVAELLTGRPRHRPFEALADVSFDLAPGEGLGIIGENGAGKSTLLKMLAGIVAPSSGEVLVRGKIASILELGSGFHPELTGRQNMVLNAAMLGLSQAEVRERVPAIIAFSELGPFLDQPVKCYSTGMAMRLGFAIATQVDPDVLIIDEALSVGDGYFQKKCMDRLLELIRQGKTLLFCSHAMYYVTAFCRRALWLRGGRVEALGPVDQVVREYENFLVAKSAAAGSSEAPADAIPEVPRRAGSPARICEVRLLGAGPLYRHGDPWEVEVEWESAEPHRAFHLGVGINRADEVEVCSFATHLDGLPPLAGQGRYSARLAVPSLPLVKGEFTLYVFLLDEAGLHVYDQEILRSAFVVDSPTYAFGLVKVDHQWSLPTRRGLAAVAAAAGA